MTDSPILTLLDRLVATRPGLDSRDYDTLANYRRDCRQVARQRQDYLALRSLPGDVAPILTGSDGRLAYDTASDTLRYTAGQYYPTEYRAAACRVLVQAFGKHCWQQAPGIPWADIRAKAAVTVGPGVARRWF